MVEATKASLRTDSAKRADATEASLVREMVGAIEVSLRTEAADATETSLAREVIEAMEA